MSLYCAIGTPQTDLTLDDLNQHLVQALNLMGSRQRVLLIPPDQSRKHSRAGELTEFAWQHFGSRVKAVLPALGTHTPMTAEQISGMFGATPKELFLEHNWRKDIVTLGEVPAEYIHLQSEGKLNFPWPAQVNHHIANGGFDLILSIGQVVPHEVIGMANFNKNIFVGTGGVLGIHRTHFLGAVYGMERMMGRADTPVRRILNYASDHFAQGLPIVYVLTVVGKKQNGLAVRGLFIGDDIECFERAAALSLAVNFEIVDEPIRKAVVYLHPSEYHSTWIGNKAVYRTRMALADDAELIILAPGVREFGEDAVIDRLIRKFGYKGTEATLRAVECDEELALNLSAAAHLIHGSSEGRFKITWSPGKLSSDEITSVGFAYRPLGEMLKQYNPEKMNQGKNLINGEEVFYISNPGLGLWAYRGRL